MMSAVGNFLGASAKLRPNDRTFVSLSFSVHWLRLSTCRAPVTVAGAGAGLDCLLQDLATRLLNLRLCLVVTSLYTLEAYMSLRESSLL